MAVIDDIHDAGQRVWLDDLSRSMLDTGELAAYRDRCGVGGITANPTIYDNALRAGNGYRDSIAAVADHAGGDAEPIFWQLAVDDVRRAADLFAGRFEDTNGDDGIVCLQLSPRLALDTEGSIEAATRLFERLDHANVMVKVPGTRPGVAAIEELTARGVSVNVTLLFGIAQWEAVWEAYERGLQRRVNAGGDLAGVTSVASFFLSRIDDAVNDHIGPEHQNAISVALAAVVYAAWSERRADDRWQALEAAGARPQRLLWASTSTKVPELAETYYPERLIAADTITTMPRRTLDALCDLETTTVARLDQRDVEDARGMLRFVEEQGIRLDRVASGLQKQGVRKFDDSYRSLLTFIDQTRSRLEEVRR